MDLLAVKPQTCLSLALTLGFGLRVALQELESFTSPDTNNVESTMMNPHSRALVLGIWEGLLVYFLLDSRNDLSYSSTDTGVIGSLVLGLTGRMLWDYSQTGEVEILARGVIGIVVGVIVAELARAGWEEVFHNPESSNDSARPRHRRRQLHRVEEEFIPSDTAAAPRRVPPPIIKAAREDLKKGRRDIDEEVDEVTSLEREASAAAGQSRRLQEERQWAEASGNNDKAFELASEIRRYQALSAELERKLRHRRSITFAKAPQKPSHLSKVENFQPFQAPVPLPAPFLPAASTSSFSIPQNSQPPPIILERRAPSTIFGRSPQLISTATPLDDA